MYWTTGTLLRINTEEGVAGTLPRVGAPQAARTHEGGENTGDKHTKHTGGGTQAGGRKRERVSGAGARPRKQALGDDYDDSALQGNAERCSMLLFCYAVKYLYVTGCTHARLG